MKNVLTNTAVLCISLFVACEGSPNSTSPSNKDRNKLALANKKQLAPGTTTRGNTTNAFATNAAIGGMMEVESSARIVKSTENPDVQTLATIMVRDHTLANGELINLAKELAIKLPRTLPESKTQHLAKMAKMKDEDEKNLYYANLMVREHEEAIALFEKAAQNENDKLKAYAVKHLPKLKHHLMEARNVLKIQHRVKGDKGNYPANISKSNQ